MNRRAPFLVMMLLLVVAACSDSDPAAAPTTAGPTTTARVAPTTSTTTAAPTITTTLVTTTVGVVPYQAAAQPPAAYDEVAADFATARESVLEPGRLAAAQFRSGDLETLYARFSTQMTSLVSLEDLRNGRDQLIASDPLGEVGLERGVRLGPTVRVYIAEIDWGEGSLTLNTSFDESDTITGMFLNPVAELPPDPAGDFESAVAFRLPFEGLWWTFWGGDTAVENYHVATAVQRHASDFVVWKDGSTHDGDGTMLDQYWAYGQRVLAPAAGTVVTVVDGLADQIPQTGSDPANPAGNHVLIEVARGEYLLIAHMQPGSIEVAEGDTVDSGQLIGLVGNSGNTSEPHIHIHLQDSPEFSVAAGGLPLVFTNYEANGSPIERDQPLADQFVVNR